MLPPHGAILAELRLFLSSDLPHVGRPPEPDDFLLYPTKRVYDGRGPRANRSSPSARTRRSGRALKPSIAGGQLQAGGLGGRGVPHGLNVHPARHRFAAELGRVAGIDAASQALGHSDLNTTLGIDGPRDQTDLEAAMERYASWLEQQREDGNVPPEDDH